MEKTTYTIAILGLKDTELKVLKTILKLHSDRDWDYRLVQSPDQNQLVAQLAEHTVDLFLVDYSQVSNWAHWEQFCMQSSALFKPVGIVVSSQPIELHCEQMQSFPRPLRMTHLVKALDELVLKQLHYVPPISESSAGKYDLTDFAKMPSADGKNTKYHALVVDDSPTIQALMEASLRTIGISCEMTDNAEHGLEMLKVNNYDIAFLDVVLPGFIDGYKLCKLVKHNDHTKKMPVIMLTSKDSPIDKIRGKMSGANSYLTKPVDQKQLEQAIKKYLEL